MKTSDYFKSKRPHRRNEPNQFSLKQSAKLAGIGEALLILWIETERFKPSIELQGAEKILGWNRYILTDHDVKRLRKIVEGNTKIVAEHVKGTNWKVAELAEAWGVSSDTIRDLFKLESGIVKIERPGTRKKRAYTTFTVPEAVADRVKGRLS